MIWLWGECDWDEGQVVASGIFCFSGTADRGTGGMRGDRDTGKGGGRNGCENSGAWITIIFMQGKRKRLYIA